MANTRKTTLTAAALMACASGVAHATTVTASKVFQTLTFTFKSGQPTTHTFNFKGFNSITGLPTGATLHNVQDQLDASVTGTLVVTNTGGVTHTITASIQDTATKTLPSPIGKLSVAFSGNSTVTTLTSGKSATIISTGKTSITSPVFTSPPSDLTAYLTNFTAKGSDIGFGKVQGNTPGTSSSVSTSVITDKLEYSFLTTTTTSTPEPATLSLLGTGLLGLGLARRMRRRKR